MIIMKVFIFCSMINKIIRYGARPSKNDSRPMKPINVFVFRYLCLTLPNHLILQLSSIISCRNFGVINYMNIYVQNLILVLFRGRRYDQQSRTVPLLALSSAELMKRASRIMTHQRKKRSTPDMEILIQRTATNPWNATGPLVKEDLMSRYTGRRPVMGQGCDSGCMSSYLAKVSRSEVQIPTDISMEDFLPAGAPLLDFLAVSMDRLETWKLPPREEISLYQRARGLSYSMLDNIRVEEILVGESSNNQISEKIEFFWDSWCKDQKMLPTQTVSMDNEEIRITLFDVYRLAGKLECKFPRLASDKVEDRFYPGIPEDRWMQLPVRLMVGNGLSWALMITMRIELNSRGQYLLENKIEIQDRVLEFLQDLPICTGLGVRTDATDIEYFYSLFSGKQIKLQGFIDLTSLAVLTGYNLRSMSMTPMGVQVVGHTLNKCASTGDGKWGLKWKDIPDTLKIYALGDLLFGHITYSVLTSILLRDTFPDPDIVNRCLDVSDHWFSIAWVMELIAFTLDGVEVHNVDFDAARSRSEMIKSLRFRYSESSTLMEVSPARVKLWINLLGGWPSLTSGGCRFLPQAREHFLIQVSLLKKSGFKWTLDVKMREITEKFESYARFGIAPEVISNCKFDESVPFHYGLFRPRSLKIPAIRLDPEKVKPFKIGKFCKPQSRGIKAIVFEWARLNPNKIRSFLVRLSEDPSFSKFYYGVYQGLRLIFKRIFNKEALRIPELDSRFRENIQDNLKKEKDLKSKSWEIYKARESRCKHLQSVLDEQDKEDQTLCLEELPKLPEWIQRKKGRKRNRSRSRSKSKPRKKMRCEEAEPAGDLDQEKVKVIKKILNVSPEKEGEEDGSEDVVIIELDEEDDVFMPGINDPKPEAKKIVPDKKKKKKGKKGKGNPASTRTYDEIIETKEYFGSDEEYGFECNFSGHLV